MGDCAQRVRSRAACHELQIGIDERIPEAEATFAPGGRAADKAWESAHRGMLAGLGGTHAYARRITRALGDMCGGAAEITKVNDAFLRTQSRRGGQGRPTGRRSKPLRGPGVTGEHHGVEARSASFWLPNLLTIRAPSRDPCSARCPVRAPVWRAARWCERQHPTLAPGRHPSAALAASRAPLPTPLGRPPSERRS
jgi:hypothetical protein